MFDTHCHLNLSPIDKNYVEIISSAKEVGVDYFVVPAIDIQTGKKAMRIADQFDHAYAALGIHPTQNLDDLDMDSSLEKIREMIRVSEKVVAVGEVGLDYYRYESSPNLQKKLLVKQINLALSSGLSLIIHNRHAGEDLIKTFDENWNEGLSRRVVFHSCEADAKLLDFAKERGIFIGVLGDVTYDKKKQEFVKNVPLENLVLETDSPLQMPEPIRSRQKYPNKPENLPIILKKVAEIKGVDEDKLEKVTTNNAKELFLIN